MNISGINVGGQVGRENNLCPVVSWDRALEMVTCDIALDEGLDYEDGMATLMGLEEQGVSRHQLRHFEDPADGGKSETETCQ